MLYQLSYRPSSVKITDLFQSTRCHPRSLYGNFDDRNRPLHCSPGDAMRKPFSISHAIIAIGRSAGGIMKRLREFLESIAFAGLKPGGQKAAGSQLKWLGPLRGAAERFLAGGAQSDPLYLTNRTGGQKMRSWSLIAVPCLVLAIAVGVALSSLLDPPEVKPVKELSAREVAAKLLPDLDRNIKLNTNPDVQIVEVAINHNGSSRLVGVVRNNTNHEIASVDLAVDLTDVTGSQVGAVAGKVEKLPPSSNKGFQFPIKQRNAAFALVRDITSH